eukprot:c11684_g1_i1.p1 GENE.c11684_g1_i1~~c11684_g1_i1.p1  ORF type:complete len:424 (+),score=39.37 c11684_g1_i1:122-1273(+)
MKLAFGKGSKSGKKGSKGDKKAKKDKKGKKTSKKASKKDAKKKGKGSSKASSKASGAASGRGDMHLGPEKGHFLWEDPPGTGRYSRYEAKTSGPLASAQSACSNTRNVTHGSCVPCHCVPLCSSLVPLALADKIEKAYKTFLKKGRPSSSSSSSSSNSDPRPRLKTHTDAVVKLGGIEYGVDFTAWLQFRIDDPSRARSIVRRRGGIDSAPSTESLSEREPPEIIPYPSRSPSPPLPCVRPYGHYEGSSGADSARWQWQGDNGWKNYEPSVSAKIEAGYATKRQAPVSIKINGSSYVVSIKGDVLCQSSVKDPTKVRAVRRVRGGSTFTPSVSDSGPGSPPAMVMRGRGQSGSESSGERRPRYGVSDSDSFSGRRRRGSGSWE